jgi:hypothetical protein
MFICTELPDDAGFLHAKAPLTAALIGDVIRNTLHTQKHLKEREHNFFSQSNYWFIEKLK